MQVKKHQNHIQNNRLVKKWERSMSRLYIVTLLIEYTMRNAELDGAQAGIKIAGEISISLDMQKTKPLRQKVKN